MINLKRILMRESIIDPNLIIIFIFMLINSKMDINFNSNKFEPLNKLQ
jgi:hypothetical protein